MSHILAFLAGVGVVLVSQIVAIFARVISDQRAKDAAAAPAPAPGPSQRLLLVVQQRHLARQLNHADKLLWLAFGGQKRPREGWRQ